MVLWWVWPAQGCNAGVKYFFIRRMGFLETIYEEAVETIRTWVHPYEAQEGG